MIRVGVLGASGYTGMEAVHWLLRHPNVQVATVQSRQANGYMLADLNPQFVRRLRLLLEESTPEQLAEECDVILSCLPHGASARRIVELLDAGCRVIDLSPDFRLSSPETYEKWFGEKHPDPVRLGNTPYGLPELFPEPLGNVQLVSNPGSCATAVALPLAPLIKERLIESGDVVVDCKMSVSTEGRALRKEGLFCEANENTSAQSIGSSRHQPEIIDVIKRFSGETVQMAFTPHVVPMERGLMATAYVKPQGAVTPNQIRECLIAYFRNSPFVRVVSHLPATRFVARTNYVDVAVRENGPRITIVSALDNLVKGGCGTAIQNLNSMFQLPLETGLELA